MAGKRDGMGARADNKWKVARFFSAAILPRVKPETAKHMGSIKNSASTLLKVRAFCYPKNSESAAHLKSFADFHYSPKAFQWIRNSEFPHVASGLRFLSVNRGFHLDGG